MLGVLEICWGGTKNGPGAPVFATRKLLKSAIGDNQLSCREPGLSCREPGLNCREQGMSCREPGLSCREPGLICKGPGLARGADAPKRGWVHGVGGRAGAERFSLKPYSQFSQLSCSILIGSAGAVFFETLQSVQSVELFNFNRAPRARERQRTPGSAREAPNPYIYLKNAPDIRELPFFATPDAPRSRKCLIIT